VRIEGETRELLLAGTATIVATRDAAMRPTLARGWGPRVEADGRRLTICVGLVAGSAIRTNLEGNGEIAINCTRPTTYRAVQVKGAAEILGPPDEGQLAAAEAHRIAFTEEVVQLGLPDDAGELLMEEELLAVAVLPREAFDQTPGPRAGTRL
jgi:hypothetical protein